MAKSPHSVPGAPHKSCGNNNASFFLFFGPNQDELTYPAHRMVFETTSRNQGSELRACLLYMAEASTSQSTHAASANTAVFGLRHFSIII